MRDPGQIGAVQDADDRPDVSFIVAAYNVGPFIAAAVRSALAQEDCRIEVVIADDASSDEGPAIIAALAARDGRVKPIRCDRRTGASAARNRAIAASRGRWLAILDGDDLITPGRTRFLLDLAAATAADLVADNIIRFDGSVPPRQTPALPQGPAPYTIEIDAASYMLANRPLRRGPNLGYLKPMIRRSFFERSALRYADDLRIGEDYRLCLDALLAGGRFIVSSVPFYHYRIREGSLSWRLTRQDIDRMIEAHAAVTRRLGQEVSAPVRVAAAAYGRALRRARIIQEVVDASKSGHWSTAMGTAVTRPGSWAFLAGIGRNIVARRLPRRARSAERAIL